MDENLSKERIESLRASLCAGTLGATNDEIDSLCDMALIALNLIEYFEAVELSTRIANDCERSRVSEAIERRALARGVAAPDPDATRPDAG